MYFSFCVFTENIITDNTTDQQIEQTIISFVLCKLRFSMQFDTLDFFATALLHLIKSDDNRRLIFSLQNHSKVLQYIRTFIFD